MNQIAFTLRFRGEAVELGHGRFWSEARAPSCIEGELKDIVGGEAVCRREFQLRGDGSLHEEGEITFGAENGFTFRAEGDLGPSPEPRLRHGTAVCEVTGGRGRLAGACGYVTSNFLLADTGELTDHHLGLLFLERPG
jgi:hypothetical protein